MFQSFFFPIAITHQQGLSAGLESELIFVEIASNCFPDQIAFCKAPLPGYRCELVVKFVLKANT
jgi:hypothetical protein